MATFSMQKLYQTAVKEGEGLGTAYEYYVKLRVLRAFLQKEKLRPRSILIAGLPEKYGYSMDFVLLADQLDSAVVVRDEREAKLANFAKMLQEVTSRKAIIENSDLGASFWGGADIPPGEGIRLAVSCEVLQRLALDERKEYINYLSQVADYIALFVPNAGNTAHARISGLRTMSLAELVQLAREGDFTPLKYGYVDMPPFPPGLKRKRQERVGAPSKPWLVVMKMLKLWAVWEDFFRFFKSRNAHIVYVIALNKRSTVNSRLQLLK